MSADIVIVGGGAAGLATAIFCRRLVPHARVVCLDGAKRIGAKILVSGGSRCNVTNRVVTERDFWGGSSHVVRGVLRAFPVSRAVEFFREIGVPLHEEEDGKLFPDSNRARTVLDGLVRALERSGGLLVPGHRVVDIRRQGDQFAIESAAGARYVSRAVVLATGGRSLPKTGSDGFGYELARRLGHRVVDTTPALVPLVLNDTWCRALSGVSHRVAVTVRGVSGRRTRLEGALLWTHLGMSGPVALDASRHWHRAALEGKVEVVLNVCPGETFESLERWLLDQAHDHPRARVATRLSPKVPAAVAAAWLERAGVAEGTTASHLTRDDRRRLVRLLLGTPLDVRGSRGYDFAEVTAGGVALDEVDGARMESRRCPGLFLVGEILDVDGRLGGFNFQWAWASAWVAARALAGDPSRGALTSRRAPVAESGEEKARVR